MMSLLDGCNFKNSVYYPMPPSSGKNDTVEDDTENALEFDYKNEDAYCPGDTKRHVIKHFGGTTYKCEFCDKILAGEQALEAHIKIHKNVTVCDIFEDSFVQKMPVDVLKDCNICKYCCKVFSGKGALTLHMKSHLNPSIHYCDQCDFSSMRKYSLQRHMNTHLAKEHKCSQCSYTTVSKRSLNKHMDTHCVRNAFECDNCDFISCSLTALKCHMLTHDQSKLYKCNHCDYQTKVLADFKEHKDNHALNGINVQEECESVVSDLLDAESIHGKSDDSDSGIVHEDDLYECEYCDYYAKEYCDFEEHLETHSSDGVDVLELCEPVIINVTPNSAETQAISGSDNETGTVIQNIQTLDKNDLQVGSTVKSSDRIVIYCHICNFNTSNQRSLRAHMKSHSNDVKFKCRSCDYVSQLKSDFNDHMETHRVKKKVVPHNSEKPLSCDYCDYTTIHKASLQIHVRSHTGEKPYKCSHCAYKSTLKCNLQKHMRTHTGEKPFQCAECSYSASQQSSLQAHKRIHTGEKPFKCEYCDYYGSHLSSLRSHMTQHMNELPYKCKSCKYGTTIKSSFDKHMRTHIRSKRRLVVSLSKKA